MDKISKLKILYDYLEMKYFALNCILKIFTGTNGEKEINIHNKGLNLDPDLDIDLDQNLDTDWIEEFESLDDKYKFFYKENINNIKFKYVYVDKDNNIEKIKEEILLLKQINLISREEMIEIKKK